MMYDYDAVTTPHYSKTSLLSHYVWNVQLRSSQDLFILSFCMQNNLNSNNALQVWLSTKLFVVTEALRQT